MLALIEFGTYENAKSLVGRQSKIEAPDSKASSNLSIEMLCIVVWPER
jgi:hypothetical protein